jgi:excisionase family DNA binding protein
MRFNTREIGVVMNQVISKFNLNHLTPEQVAKCLGVKTSTVYAWISRGEMQAYKFDRRRFISLEQMHNFQQYRGKGDYVDYRYANGPIR